MRGREGVVMGWGKGGKCGGGDVATSLGDGTIRTASCVCMLVLLLVSMRVCMWGVTNYVTIIYDRCACIYGGITNYVTIIYDRCACIHGGNH